MSTFSFCTQRPPVPWPWPLKLLLLSLDPCAAVFPPCLGEADRFSLEALRHIHREMDDDQDGGIEVEESVEVNKTTGRTTNWLFGITWQTETAY